MLAPTVTLSDFVERGLAFRAHAAKHMFQIRYDRYDSDELSHREVVDCGLFYKKLRSTPDLFGPHGAVSGTCPHSINCRSCFTALIRGIMDPNEPMFSGG